MRELFESLAIGLFVPLLISCALMAWTVRGLRHLIAALKFRVELLEHPERFPPQHQDCRCVVNWNGIPGEDGGNG